jgi:hypothetical protein
VALDRIAPILRQAVVATEDERFYRHHGVDLIGVLRALPYDLAHFSLAQGASTITEQVAKILYLRGNDHTLWRKLEDAAVALKLEGRYGKEQLLAALPEQRLLRQRRLRRPGRKQRLLRRRTEPADAPTGQLACGSDPGAVCRQPAPPPWRGTNGR